MPTGHLEIISGEMPAQYRAYLTALYFGVYHFWIRALVDLQYFHPAELCLNNRTTKSPPIDGSVVWKLLTCWTRPLKQPTQRGVTDRLRGAYAAAGIVTVSEGGGAWA